MEIEKVCLPLKTNLQSIVRFDPSQAGAKKCIFGLKSFARTYQMDFMAAPSLEPYTIVSQYTNIQAQNLSTYFVLRKT